MKEDFREPNPRFEAWRESLPEKHWARYDLSACRLGWEAAAALIDGHWIGTPIEHEVGVWEGLKRIAAERTRQVLQHGYLDEHDDAHNGAELAEAAGCYVVVAAATARGSQAIEWTSSMLDGLSDSLVGWPWDEEFWKPSDDPIRNLEKAGALIVAEIDRLLRMKTKVENEPNDK